MVDKELIEKICNVTATSDEINISTTSLHYDKEKPFEKYYEVKMIKKAIDKYLNKEVTDCYLASWANLYNWIINGGFSKRTMKRLYKENIIQQIIKSEIFNYLDALSFFSEDDLEEDDQEEYDFHTYEMLDQILQTIEEWRGMYTPIESAYGNCNQYILFINEKRGQYFTMYSGYLDNKMNRGNMIKINKKEFEQKIKELDKLQYEYLIYQDVLNEE
ncbi:MAG: hypothetical protein NC182_06475 [Prevotella sp.]|nr:hypothetical protein [Staphylococcus sp.]MCM1350831.1 hypothetical protein [Prevotella sp.]